MHSLHLCVTFAQQCHSLYSEVIQHASAGDDWVFSFTDVALFVGESRQNVRKLILTWEALVTSGKQRLGGRPKSLDSFQLQMVIDYVCECDREMTSLTQTALLKWVNSTFDKSLSFGWLQKFIKSESSLFVVAAEPLETARADVTDEQLKENAKELEEKIKKAHPELVMNMDETGLDCKKDTEKIKVVSTHNECTNRIEANHILLLCPQLELLGGACLFSSSSKRCLLCPS